MTAVFGDKRDRRRVHGAEQIFRDRLCLVQIYDGNADGITHMVQLGADREGRIYNAFNLKKLMADVTKQTDVLCPCRHALDRAIIWVLSPKTSIASGSLPALPAPIHKVMSWNGFWPCSGCAYYKGAAMHQLKVPKPCHHFNWTMPVTMFSIFMPWKRRWTACWPPGSSGGIAEFPSAPAATYRQGRSGWMAERGRLRLSGAFKAILNLLLGKIEATYGDSL